MNITKKQERVFKEFKQLFLYLIVGGIATVVEWGFFWLFDNWLHYSVATSLAFALSTFANWLAGRLIMFKSTEQNISREIFQIYATSILGLLFNLIIMWIAIDCLGIPNMISKITATAIVFFWNFFIRKFVIYKI